jgi:glucokinase
MSKHYVGIDLGGTNIKGGVVDAQGKVLHFESIETEGEQGRDHVLDRMAMLAGKVRDAAGIPRDQIAGVGIGSPGPLNTRTGIIHEAPNLPGWVELPLGDEISKRTGYPTFIENDANSAALAEAVAGAGKGTNCMIMLTLGTGIGGGIVIGGRVWHGADDIAAELGHVSINYDGPVCNCGTPGCVEAYASATGVVRRAREALAEGARSSLAEGGEHALAEVPDERKCERVFKAAAAGDELAQKIVDDTIIYLATAMGSLINVFNPDMIVLFGGMTKAGGQLFGPLRREVARRCFPIGAKRCQIVQSELGEHAGVIGAATTARQRLEEREP